ncbi:MAG: hypothetical protein Q9175_006396 [Cornicularia normoerica]
MRVTLATLAVLAHAGLISATDVCAQQAKSDPTPSCNAIHHPGLHDIIPGGTPYTIRWGNNTGTSISLVLCQGVSTNIQDIGCIVDHIPNTGSFVWTPATDLVPAGNHNYGLKIIANTGDFQWSDQFGISNSVSNFFSSTPAAAPTSSKKAVKESAKAVKETANSVKQASDEQTQEPTGTVEPKKHHTKDISNTLKIYSTDESKAHTKHYTHTKDHLPKPFATGQYLSAKLVYYEGANATHILEHQKSHVLSSVIATSVTESVAPTVALSVPTTLPATPVAPSTSLKSSSSAGGAARAAVTGVPLVLRAMAALVP